MPLKPQQLLTFLPRQAPSFAIRDSRNAKTSCIIRMMLKPQDIMVLAKLAMSLPTERSYTQLAASLGLSTSEAHASVKRARQSGLIDPETKRVRKARFLELLLHGVPYVFPAERTGVTRGIPTSYAAEPLRREISSGELPPVWPHPEGTHRGEGLLPLYRSAPEAARTDPELYEWLALIDAVRSGRARERKLASDELRRRLADD